MSTRRLPSHLVWLRSLAGHPLQSCQRKSSASLGPLHRPSLISFCWHYQKSHITFTGEEQVLVIHASEQASLGKALLPMDSLQARMTQLEGTPSCKRVLAVVSTHGVQQTCQTCRCPYSCCRILLQALTVDHLLCWRSSLTLEGCGRVPKVYSKPGRCAGVLARVLGSCRMRLPLLWVCGLGHVSILLC